MSDSNSIHQVYQWLELPSSELKLLMGRAKLLGKINTAFTKLLPKSSQNHLLIMNIQQDTVIIAATSATQLTHLRYDHQNLLTSIKQIPGLEGVTRLKFKIQPTAFRTSQNPTRRAFMSEQTCHLLRQSAEGFTDSRLQTALRRLSKNNAPTS